VFAVGVIGHHSCRVSGRVPNDVTGDRCILITGCCLRSMLANQ